MSPVRIGAVGYLNARPLTWALDRDPHPVALPQGLFGFGIRHLPAGLGDGRRVVGGRAGGHLLGAVVGLHRVLAHGPGRHVHLEGVGALCGQVLLVQDLGPLPPGPLAGEGLDELIDPLVGDAAGDAHEVRDRAVGGAAAADT